MTNDRGVALIVVLLVMVSLSALAMSLALLSSTESRVTASFRDGLAAHYGAEAALELALTDLAAERDITAVLAGAVTSTFTDGPPGVRRLPDGTFVDLHTLNSPPWRLYGYGLLPGDAQVYTVVWVAAAENPPSGRLSLTAHGYSLSGARRMVEATVAVSTGNVDVISRREIR
jgi:hypothetical protein